MKITVSELKDRISANEDLIIIDVREEWEFEESCIPGTRNIPLYTILDRISELGDKTTEIIVHCRTGVRGNTARAVLNQQGFINVKNLEGGIEAYLA